MKTKQKNKKYSVDGNQPLDQLFFMMENQSVLSENLEKKIMSIAFHIQHQNIGQEGYNFITEKIEQLIDELRWVNIFSRYFIDNLNYLMKRALEFEFERNENE